MITRSRPRDISDGLVEVIDYMRRDRGMSIKTLCHQTGIPRATMYRRIGGLAPFYLNELAALADVLEVSVVELVQAAEEAIA